MTCGNNHMWMFERIKQTSKKFVAAIERHLGIKGEYHYSLKIAPHHFQLSLLQHRKQCGIVHWSRPLMLEEARSTGNSTSIIDFHPKSTMLQKLFYQTPNVPKSELLWKLNEWSSLEKRMNTMKNNHNISVLSSGTNFDDQNLIQDPPQVKMGYTIFFWIVSPKVIVIMQSVL